MLMITTALYCEAQPIIQHYNLKKDSKLNKFQVFRNEDILLLITNPGSIPAAVGVTWLCTLQKPGPFDLFLNIGVCASSDTSVPVGTIFLCNKITEQMTNRCFFPDVLFPHPFLESGILSVPVPVQKESDIAGGEKHQEMLIDMEAAGVYQAASCFYKTHQLAFLKIVSDYGGRNEVNPEIVMQLIKLKLPELTDWFGQLKNMQKTGNEKLGFTSEEEGRIDELSRALFCTVTMENKLRQMLTFYKLIHGSITEQMTEALGKLVDNPCRTKLEGKKYFELFRKQLL